MPKAGFVVTDGKGVLSPSAAGVAFLIYVVARDITDPAEAFTASYQAANEQRDGAGWTLDATSKDSSVM